MTEPQLGRLKRLHPKSAWESEAHGFTPWLAENIGLLGEALGLEIELVQREMPVGRFSLDIFAKDVGSGREVIIENQLEATDHGHLGQLLTYAAGLKAKVVVWISPEFRDEHRRAIEWLNVNSVEDVSFFAVEMELLGVDDSLPAPNFKLVAQPSEWEKHIAAESRQGRSERQMAYHDFFDDFVQRLNSRSPGFTNIRRVGYDSWINFATGRSGFAFSVSFVTNAHFRVELEIDTGDYDANRSAFSQLREQSGPLEQELRQPLIWDEVEKRRACRIYIHEDGAIDSAPERLEELKEWAIDRLVRFREVFGARIKSLRLEASGERQS